MTSRFMKTPKLGIVLQVTDVAATGPDAQTWMVHDVERNRGFRVIWSAGATPDGHALAQRDLDYAIGLAVERALVTPPEKIGGNVYDVTVTAGDLRPA